ncbi:hypothetical protein D3C71_1623740 [compost metagenome]
MSAVVVLPSALVAVTLTLRLLRSMEPAVMVWVAVQVPLLFVAATAAPPPNWLKSIVTPVMVLLLLSPPPTAVLFQVAVTVSPILYAPLVPVAPEMLMAPLVTVGGGGVLTALAIVKLRNSKNAG